MEFRDFNKECNEELNEYLSEEYQYMISKLMRAKVIVNGYDEETGKNYIIKIKDVIGLCGDSDKPDADFVLVGSVKEW